MPWLTSERYMPDSSQPLPFTTRIPTGIAGFDRILHGGLLQGAIYLLTGQAGTGKTILANQIAFHHVATGGRVTYLTLLTETHDRMLALLRPLAFFDPSCIGDALEYLSAAQTVLEQGREGLRQFVRDIVRAQRTTLLIIDGLVPGHPLALSAGDLTQFLHDVQVFNAATGCTTLVVTGPPPATGFAVEQTMVDGVIRLSDELIDQRAFRELEVSKFRGSDSVRGRHTFEITARGIVVYPRTEAILAQPAVQEAATDTRLSVGIAGLDAMLQGGLLAGSTTLVLGPPGSGKTILGLHVLAAGVVAQQPGLYFGFYEPPQRLLRKADQLGLNLRQADAAQALILVWQPPMEDNLDRLAQRLLTAVGERQITRLVIDGLDGFRAAAVHPERLSRFFMALVHELRAREVTTVFTLELPGVVGPIVTLPVSSVSTIIDNLILLRHVEVGAQTHRLISIMETRDSDYDPAVREFAIGEQGMTVAASSESAARLLRTEAGPHVWEQGPRPAE